MTEESEKRGFIWSSLAKVICTFEKEAFSRLGVSVNAVCFVFVICTPLQPQDSSFLCVSSSLDLKGAEHSIQRSLILSTNK